MSIRLFNDNGCETPNEIGVNYASHIHNELSKIVDLAVQNDISLRDLTTVVIDEITILTAQKRLRKGIDERRTERKESFKAGQSWYNDYTKTGGDWFKKSYNPYD